MHTVTTTTVDTLTVYTYRGVKFEKHKGKDYFIFSEERLKKDIVDPRLSWNNIIKRIDEMKKDEHTSSNMLMDTSCGIKVDVFNPKPEMFHIEDIAHALSQTCRFGGHTKNFYSVAQHSIHCFNFVVNRENKLAMLLHDASEAYMADLIRPVKNNIPEYEKIEHNLMFCIAEKFGFQYPFDDEIREVDDFMLERELDHFIYRKTDNPIFSSLEPEQAKKIFLQNFYSTVNLQDA